MSETLYRFWGGEDLLYVGISVNAFKRASQHRRSAAWWDEADRLTFERFPDRASVATAEAAAIKAELPKYNIKHKEPKAAQDPSAPPKLDFFQASEVAVLSDCSYEHVLAAALAGRIHGYRRGARGHWTFVGTCVDSWLHGEGCKHMPLKATA